MITTERLSKKFTTTLAVDQLSLQVQQGEVFGFLGPNGAGKTTTVRMLTALIKPTNGKAEVNGFQLGKQNQAIRQSVGILTETPGLYENLSAEYNLQIYANLYDVPDPKAQVEKYLRLMGLWERRYDEAGTFSKGMKQKLAIARALLHEPQILFLDEPTAALDPEAALMVRESIQELRKEGRTIFLTTHNLDEAERLCDRIGVFKTRLLALDTTENLRRQMFGRRVVVHLANPNPGFERLVSNMPGIHEASLFENKLLISLDEPENQNPEIIRTLVNAGAEIRFVGELRRSLEDIYLQLIKTV